MTIQAAPREAAAASNDTDLAIVAHNLVKTYPGGVRALNGLSLAVATGTIFALLGPNGAGKSTTVKILTTLSRPDSGSARVAGFDVVARPSSVRRAIGYVSQKAAVDPEATGRENLSLQGRIYGLRGRELRRRVDELLERIGLAEAADRVAGTYSGGMQRKLDILMGLIHRPKVLFLDEPTTGLDPEARAELWAEIERLAREERLTILLTTHYLEEADRLAARVAIVDQGRVVVEGSPEELKGELRGDTIRVELADGATEPRVQAVLEHLPGVRDVTLQDGAVYARANSGGQAIPVVLAALERAGIPVAAATVARPSLDDVYLRYVGRSFDAAGEKGTER
ncbi:ATP-binding cassette domain-containing protein [Sphaerobacter sp.]|uniref:ATP-binding cassette domain-containing protein n=1 Tax=Sphaerobacter sp. TaxID=2099654 RepID=UPI001D1C27C3|nr:ATP-binding cassette domain-containing protein [Sphaerobacter sp.]MBX5446402.1 ATP-binding cassette domain-containing protein [Sphaerobacter sp.]